MTIPYWFAEDDVVQLLAALRTFRRAEDRMRQRVSADMSVNARDMQALQHLIAAEGAGTDVTPRTLAAHLGISTASTTQLLDRLERSGHVARFPHPQDRRSVVVRATAHAHEEIRARLSEMHARMRRVAADMPEHCRPAAVEFLLAMAAEFDRGGAAPELTAGPDPQRAAL